MGIQNENEVLIRPGLHQPGRFVHPLSNFRCPA